MSPSLRATRLRSLRELRRVGVRRSARARRRKRSNPPARLWRDGLLRRGACHRARIRATRWLLAMTWEVRALVRFLRVRLFAGLHQIKALFELAEQASKIPPLLRGETRQYFLFLAQEARDQFLVERCALARQA